MQLRGTAQRAFRRAAAIGLSIAVIALVAERAVASGVSVDACECLLLPGDVAQVSVTYSNTTASPAELIVELTLPNEKKLYLSPIGLVERPVAWLTVPAGTNNASAEIIDQMLTPQSLPFGNWPLVPPFRYAVAATLVNPSNGAPIAPFGAGYFDFEPFEPSAPPTEPGTLHVFAHQHGDPAWLLRERDAFPAMAEWIAASIALAQAQPSYRFVIDQPIVLQAFEQIRPDLKASLQQLIDAGRVEMAGGLYVASDLNLLSGESIARQIVYGQRYLEQRWGRRSRIGWNLDQFGHPHQMPQLFAKGGMPYYAFTRGVPSLSSLGLPGSEFYWRSPDGSRVLANNVGNGYQLGRTLGDVSPDDQELTEIFLRVQPSSITGNFLTGSGADVSEQVLNDYDLNVLLPDAIESWNASQAPGVSARISTPSEFFTAIETSGTALPTIGPMEFQTDGELDDPRIFPASYASHMEVKQANERLEHLLLDAEKLATIAWIEGATYPEQEFDTQGKNVARNQTHDYLPGTGVDAIYDDADTAPDDFGDRAAQTETALRDLRDDAVAHLVDRIDTALDAATPQKTWVVFNTMAWERTDLVRIPLVPAEITQPAKLVDDAGAEIAYQISQRPDTTFELVFVATLPATGWATFHLVDGAPAQAPGEVGQSITSGLLVPLGSKFRMNVDSNGYLRGLFATHTNEPLIQRPQAAPDADDLGGLLWWADDPYGNSYDYGPALNVGSQAGAPASTYAVTGPVLTRVVSMGNVATTSVSVREMAAVPALGRVEFDTTVYWTDVNKNLYLRFPFEPKVGATITTGVPYGHMTRSAGHQPVLGWADWGTPKLGVSVLNRALFDHQFSRIPGAIGEGDVEPQLLDVTLLHSISRAVFGDFPSESMKQQGVHKYRYALVPHVGGWREAQTPRRAHEFGSPLFAVEATAHDGTLPKRRSYLSLNSASDAVVTVFQRDGADVVVRLYDTTGRVASHTLSFPFLDATTVDETDLLGGFLDSLGSGSTVEVATAPEEVATVRLTSATPVVPETSDTGVDFSRSIDLATASGVPRMTGADSADLAGRAVTSIGDIDGDGYDDLLVGANQGDGPDNTGASGAGEVAVVFGGPRTRFGNGFSLAAADMTLYGLRPGTFAGTRITSGDLDCDGFSDIVIGSVGNPTGEESRNASGVTWVVFGGPREILGASVDLASQADLEIWGQPGDIAGEHVSVADLDANGCDDLVIGAPSGDGANDALESTGEAYILFGGTRAEVVQSGTRVLGLHHDAVIYGAQVFDHFGWAIEPGDFDGDGYDDLALSAIDADGINNGAQAAGDVYLFWGGPQASITGAFSAATLDNMVVFHGIDTGDLAGFNFGTGDVDADGYDDLLVGVPFSDGRGNVVGDVTGEAALWFGRSRAEIATTNALANVADVMLYGALADEATGHTVFVSDLNGDGLGDLVIGAPVANGFQGQRPESGSVHVMLGRAQAEWPAEIVLGPQTSNYLIRGAKGFESAGFGLSSGDLDGDGRQDLVIGSPFYSGTGSGTERIGAAYVLFADSFDLDTSDVVAVERAEWNPETGLLRIAATSSVGGAAYRVEDEIFVREGASTTQLTEDASSAERLFADGGALVWERFDGADPDVFFWNGGAIVPLSDDTALDGFPRTDGVGAVWMGNVGGDSEIFYWDGASVEQLTDDASDDLFPDLSNGRVVWMGFDGNDYEIFLWENGVVTQLTDDAERDQDPRIDGADVVWSSFDGNDYEIERFDGVATTALTNDAADDVLPQVEDGEVAWMKLAGGDLDVRLWDGAQVRTLSDDALPDAGIALSQGRVAWSSGSGDAAEIYLYDPSANPLIQRITNDAAADVAPALDGATLVWEKRAAGAETDAEIWSFDGATTERVTDDDADSSAPVASGGRVAWLGETVDSTLRVAGIGDLAFDPATGLYEGSFVFATPPPSLTIESPLGGAATVEVATLPSVGEDVVVEDVTDDGDDLSDLDPQIAGNRVAWAGFDGSDLEIFLWDGAGTQQITDDDADDSGPRLHDGKLVWLGHAGGDPEVFHWDGTRVLRLTDDALEQAEASIHAGEVVWTEGSGDAREIVLYRAGARTRVTRNATADAAPAVEHGVVVFQGFDGNDWEIYRWQRGRVTQLTDNDEDDVAPLLADGAVAWLGFDGADWEVYVRAGDVTTRVTDDAADAAALAFADGVAVWEQSDGADLEIWRWESGTLAQLSDDEQDDRAPRTDAGVVVWQGGPIGAPEIFVHSSATGIVRLTTDLVPDEGPQIDAGRVVWQAPNGSTQNLDVFFWDGAAVRNLSAAGDGASDQKPSIGAGGRVAWQGFDGDPEIEVQNAGGQKQQLTHNRFEEFVPRVDAVTGWVIWHGLDDLRQRVDNPGAGEGGTGATVVGGDFEVFLWNGASVQRLTTRDALDDFYPSIHDGKAVWLGGDGTDVEVFFWNGTSTQQLTSNAFDESNARTHGGRAVWQGWDGHDMEIFYWSGSGAPQRITDNQTNDVSPEIWGDEIVWSAFDGTDFEIVRHVVSTGVSTQLTSNAGDDVGAQIADGLIVWQGFDGQDFEIFRFDTFVVTQLTNDALRDERPRLDPLGRIVWQKSDGFDSEIFHRADGVNRRVTDNLHDDSNPEIFDGTIVWQGFDGRDFEIRQMQIP